MSKEVRPMLSAAVALSLAVLLTGSPALADAWGGDLPILTGILTTLSEGIAKASQTLTTLRQTYDQTKQIVGFAEDAAAAYQTVSHLNAQSLGGDVVAQLDAAFPDFAYLRKEPSRAGPWAPATGELQRMLSLCLTGPAGSCQQVQEVMTYQQTRSALEKTFGLAPASAYSLVAVDHEATQAIRGGQAQTGRSAKERNLSDAWMKSCTSAGGSKSDNLAACQAAGSSAQVESLRATADVADQVAEGNRLSALALEQRNEERKRDMLEALERHQVLLDGESATSLTPGVVTADGFNLVDGTTP